ncbi:hypothetical protein DB42_EV00290 [Neochlamydia sp. EPS4]|uniref:hypothetical protein n=1 Tax=Neochlamydia sp. EPS4 TaxID=1478175 RepID=UPI0005829100|nr:hypothetical protein [Neochlamydia sp. EPS4]KIC75639.1 hypothetical protein DB42_EV00290 [Neochlamydia sp. EPS4]
MVKFFKPLIVESASQDPYLQSSKYEKIRAKTVRYQGTTYEKITYKELNVHSLGWRICYGVLAALATLSLIPLALDYKGVKKLWLRASTGTRDKVIWVAQKAINPLSDNLTNLGKAKNQETNFLKDVRKRESALIEGRWTGKSTKKEATAKAQAAVKIKDSGILEDVRKREQASIEAKLPKQSDKPISAGNWGKDFISRVRRNQKTQRELKMAREVNTTPQAKVEEATLPAKRGTKKSRKKSFSVRFSQERKREYNKEAPPIEVDHQTSIKRNL